MNYGKIYIKLCRRGIQRFGGTSKRVAGFERHHVFPQALYKSNLIAHLTAREHYIAHILLYKAFKCRYGEIHYKTIKMAHAAWNMMRKDNFQSRTFTSKQYEILMNIKRNNDSIKIKTDINHPFRLNWGLQKEAHPRFGKVVTTETRRLIGAANKGKLAGDKNPSKREDVRNKISKAKKGKKLYASRDKNPKTRINDENRQKILEMWNIEKHQISGYKFCRKYNTQFDVSPSGISNIIYACG